MEESNKELILTKIDELVNIIKSEENYIRYEKITNQMKSNSTIIELINEIKQLNKKLINLQYKNIDTTEIEDKIKEKENFLNSMPIYLEYKYLQEDLDNLFASL